MADVPEYLGDKGSYGHGIFLLFTNQFDAAESMLQSRVECSSRQALLYAMCSFISGLSSMGDHVLKEALNRIWKAEAVGKRENTLSSLIVRADAHLLGSVVQFLQESFIRGAWNLRTSWKLYKEGSKRLQRYKGPDRDDIQAACDGGVGLFNLLVSILPPTVLRVAEFLGFSGDRNLALNLLHSTQESDTAQSVFGTIFLLSYYTNISEQVGDYDEFYPIRARDLLAWCDERYPNGIVFMAFKVRLLRSTGQLEEAIEQCHHALEHIEQIPAMKHLFYWHEAWSSVLLMRWSRSVELLELLLASSTFSSKSNYLAMYSFMAGLCHKVQHGQKAAARYFEQVPELLSGKMNARDEFVKRKAEEQMNGADAVFGLYEIVLHFGAFSQLSETHLHEVRKLIDNRYYSFETSSETTKMQYLLFSASIAYMLRDTKQCLILLDQMFNLEPFLSKEGAKNGLFPHAYYLQTRCFLDDVRYEDALESHKKGESYSNYDLEKLLKFKLHALKNTIRMKSQ